MSVVVVVLVVIVIHVFVHVVDKLFCLNTCSVYYFVFFSVTLPSELNQYILLFVFK